MGPIYSLIIEISNLCSMTLMNAWFASSEIAFYHVEFGGEKLEEAPAPQKPKLHLELLLLLQW